MNNLTEREKEVLKQAIASFEDDVKACADFYYLSDIPKTAKEIGIAPQSLWRF